MTQSLWPEMTFHLEHSLSVLRGVPSLPWMCGTESIQVLLGITDKPQDPGGQGWHVCDSPPSLSEPQAAPATISE